MFVNLVGVVRHIVVIPAEILLKKKFIIKLKDFIARQKKGKSPIIRENENED